MGHFARPRRTYTCNLKHTQDCCFGTDAGLLTQDCPKQTQDYYQAAISMEAQLQEQGLVQVLLKPVLYVYKVCTGHVLYVYIKFV